MLASNSNHFIGLPAFPFATITTGISGVRTGVKFNPIRTMNVAARIGPRPILMIHCRDDLVVPPDNTRRNFANAREPQQLWWIARGGHIGGIDSAPKEYRRRVIEFFRSSLR